jgi:hypothetical protein
MYVLNGILVCFLIGGVFMCYRNERTPIVPFLRFCSLLAVAVGTTWAQWGNPVVDTITATQAREETSLQSLCIDDSGWVHLVWKQQQMLGWRIFYCTNSPTGIWSVPEEVGDSTAASFNPGIAVSSGSGIPFVAFQQDEEIYLAYRTGAIWHRNPITSNTQLDCSATIAVDATGLVHLAWITDDPLSGQYKIAYAMGDTLYCNVQTLAGSDLGPFGTGAAPFIAVSPEGIAHVVYRGGDYGNYHIHHAWNDSLGSADWNYEILYSGNANDFSSAMVIENDGDCHLAVSGNDGWGFPGKVFYLSRPANQPWQQYELASLMGSATEPALSIDNYGAPHIVWMETSGNLYTGNIFYSNKDSTGTWQVTSVIGTDHFFPSFQVDQQGYGHFSCHTGGNTGDYDVYHVRSSGVLTGLHESENAIAAGSYYCILGNHPNPVQGSTTIWYHTAISGYVTLKVYNSVGEEVAVLVSEFMPAGTYKMTWQPNQLSAGVHFLRLTIGEADHATKCLILR